MSPLLLDTCALIWITNGDPISTAALDAISATTDDIFISPISAWELGLLTARGRIAMPLPPEAIFETILKQKGTSLAPMPPKTLIASSFLPGEPPKDPADRIVIATARAEEFTLVTRDRKILSYASQGHIQALEC